MNKHWCPKCPYTSVWLVSKVSRSRNDQLRSRDQSSKVNSDQEIKDQLRTAQIKRSKFKGQLRSKDQSSKINADQRIKTQIKMVSKFSKKLCLILSF